MECLEFRSQIDEFLDGDLAQDQQKLMLDHQTGCSECKANMIEAQRIQNLLHDFPVPEPRAGFHDRVLAVATDENRKKRPRGFTTGFASAIAAGLMIWVVVGLFSGEKVTTNNSSNSIPGISIALNDTRNVKVTFNSERALKDATISLIIPDNVELTGYPGQRELKWKTSLSPGSNYLRLPIMAVKAVDGQLIVKIEHQNKTKTLRLNVRITQPGLTQIRTELLGA